MKNYKNRLILAGLNMGIVYTLASLYIYLVYEFIGKSYNLITYNLMQISLPMTNNFASIAVDFPVLFATLIGTVFMTQIINSLYLRIEKEKSENRDKKEQSGFFIVNLLVYVFLFFFFLLISNLGSIAVYREFLYYSKNNLESSTIFIVISIIMATITAPSVSIIVDYYIKRLSSKIKRNVTQE